MKLLRIISLYLLAFSFSAQASTMDIPPGALATKPAFFEYAIYLIEPLKEDPLQLAQKIIKEKYTDFKLTKKPNPKHNSIRIRVNRKAQTEYKPPNIESLKYYGEGISKDQANKLQQVNTAVIVYFYIPINNRADGIKKASKFIADLSKATNGVIWDEETRQCFDYATWVKYRVDSFDNGVPDISRQIVIHAYKDNGYIRAISLGMAKFSLPDIEVSDYLWSDNRSVGNLINLFAQSLYEIDSIREEGKFVLDVDKIKNNNVRKTTKESLFENAENNINIHIIKGNREEGDSNNRIIEIIFDNYPGKNKREKMQVMLSKLWGWKDELINVKHNKEILAASKRAKLKLPSIKEKIEKGLSPGEYYMFKAPFVTPEGNNEWMWVEVKSWNEKNKVLGILRNKPYNVPNLKDGSDVTLEADNVFDYIHTLPDGTSEGNETGALIQKYSQ